MTAVVLIWGFYYLGVAKMLEGGWDPVFMNAVRFSIAALVLVLIVVLRGGGGELLKVQKQAPGKLLAPAWAGVLAGTALISFAQESVASGIAGVILSSTPLFAALLGLLPTFGARRVGPVAWGGVVVGLAGVALLHLPGASGGSSVLGIMMLVVSAACFALEAHMVAKWFSGHDLLAVTALLTVWTAVGFWVWVAIAGNTASGSWLLIIIFAVLSNSLAFALYLWLVKGPGPTFANVYAYLVPIIALAAGFLFNEEAITWIVVAGAVLCVGGALLVGRDRADAVEH